MPIRAIVGVIAGLGMLAVVGSTTGNPAHDLTDTDCLSCHDDKISQPVNHFIEGNDDCVFCHEFSATGTGMSTASDDDICQVCHVANSDAVESGAHIGVSCMECHEAHSSTYVHLFRKAETSLCLGACHGDHDLGVSHPMGEGVADERVGTAMSCVSTCHSMHQPAEPKMLQMVALDLCEACHAENF